MIKEKLNNLIATAIKSKNPSKLKVLRLIKAEYQKFETSGSNKVLDDAAEITILKKLQKQWKEELEAFSAAGRDTTALAIELGYLEEFLPKELTEAEQEEVIRKIIIKYLQDLPIEERASMKNLGGIMKIIKKEYPSIEGKKVSEMYKSIIG